MSYARRSSQSSRRIAFCYDRTSDQRWSYTHHRWSDNIVCVIMGNPFFTIGHSTRPITGFVELLKEAEVGLVVDVRTVPRSRTNPQYNTDVLPRSLIGSQIGYEHIAALGGLRGRASDVPAQANAFWENQSFHNYADYAMSEDFRAGLRRLRELGRAQRCAIMCA